MPGFVASCRALFLVALAVSPVLAGAELLLEDGQVLEGTSVEKRESLYYLTLQTGAVLPVPVELVSEVRLTGDDRRAPTGLRIAEPETLVGRPDAARLPSRAEMTEVLGRPSRFRRSLIDPHWRPESDLRTDASLNNFNPSRWYTPPIDPVWTPRSAFDAAEDVTDFNPVRWYRAPIDPTWWPSDGFRRDRD